jgi:hypothetical protein
LSIKAKGQLYADPSEKEKCYETIIYLSAENGISKDAQNYHYLFIKATPKSLTFLSKSSE